MGDKEVKVSKLLKWWNRSVTQFYHWNYDWKCSKGDHRKLCPYCKYQFEKWLKENEK
jgi:hypothetical protein